MSLKGSGVVALVRLAPRAAAAKAAWTSVSLAVLLLLPAALTTAVDGTLRNDPRPAVTLAALLLMRVLADVFAEISAVNATTGAAASLRHDLARHVFALGVGGTRRYATGDLVTRLTGNAATAGRAVPEVIEVVVASLASLGGLVALTLIDWRLGVVFLIGALPMTVLLRHLMSRVSRGFDDYLRHLSAIAARLTDALAGRRTLRAAGTADRETGRVLAPLPDLAAAGLRTFQARRAVSWQVAFVAVAVRVAVLAVAGLGVLAGRITPGEFLAAAMYLAVAMGITQQVDTLMFLAGVRSHAARVSAVLADEPTGRHHRRHPGLRPPPGPGNLSFRGISARIGDRLVLDRINLDIPAGTALAVVGRSGSGKSTLSLLAGRLVDPDAGEILLDGMPLSAMDPASLRTVIGYAFDRPILVGGTVREALTCGRPDTTTAELAYAVGIAQADDFVRRLPAGLDTPLAETPLSGGELQRLGLARAVAHAGRVLILDDATSSLDTVTEAEVAEALTSSLAGTTRLIVAHRATTAARADAVAWLDDGRIRAMAPHAVLWAEEASYRAVFGCAPEEDR